MRQMLEMLGLKERDRFQLFKELKLEWKEQPGLDRRTIMEGFAQFKSALTEENQEKKLLLLKHVSEKFKSYHAASLYCVESLQSLEIKTVDFSKKFQAITEWYLNAAHIHGSPVFLHLAVIYYDFAYRSDNYSFYQQAYIYAKLGKRWEAFSTAAMYNAFCGKGFSATNAVFKTSSALEESCLKALNKNMSRPVDEAYYTRLVEERSDLFLRLIDNQTKNNFFISVDL